MLETFLFLFLFLLVLLLLLVLDYQEGPDRVEVSICFVETVEEDLKNFDEKRPAIGGRDVFV